MIDYPQLQSLLRNLELQWENLQNVKARSSVLELDVEAIKESVIKRFDLAVEMSWKLLLKFLTEEVGVQDLPNGPKPILRLADQNNLLNGRIDEWIEYINARNASSHDYSGEKAEGTLKVIPSFIEDANALYQAMSQTQLP